MSGVAAASRAIMAVISVGVTGFQDVMKHSVDYFTGFHLPQDLSTIYNNQHVL